MTLRRDRSGGRARRQQRRELPRARGRQGAGARQVGLPARQSVRRRADAPGGLLARPLGCADEVLAQTKGCIKSADIIINKEQVLTGGYPGRHDLSRFRDPSGPTPLRQYPAARTPSLAARDFRGRDRRVADVAYETRLARGHWRKRTRQAGRISGTHRHRRRRRQLGGVARHRQHAQGRGDRRLAPRLLSRCRVATARR